MQNMSLSGKTSMNRDEEMIAKHGDKGQGERMTEKKAQLQAKRGK